MYKILRLRCFYFFLSDVLEFLEFVTKKVGFLFILFLVKVIIVLWKGKRCTCLQLSVNKSNTKKSNTKKSNTKNTVLTVANKVGVKLTIVSRFTFLI